MLLAGLVALVLGLLLQPVAVTVLTRRGVLDRPSERSSHRVATPRGGGVVVVLSLLVGAWTGGAGPAVALLTLLVAGVLGLVEDVRGVPPLPRLLVQLAAAVPAVVVLLGDAPLLWPFAVFFVAATVNAVNFMDGVNGISAGTGAAAGATYAVLLDQQGDHDLAVLAVAVAAACVAFAPFNVPRARVFLGDSGSYGLGAALAVLPLGLLAAGATPEACVAPLALYLADTGTTLLRRFRVGEAWYLPHRSHAYQRLTDLGWSHSQVSLTVTVLVLLCGALGALTLYGVLVRLLADALLAGVVVGYLALPARVQRRRAVGA